MAVARRQAIVEFMVGHPSATLGELLTLDQELKNLSIAEVIHAESVSTQSTSPQNLPATGSLNAVDTRTAAGRVTYDASVLATIRKFNGRVGAETLRTSAGGDPHQIRRALARLVRRREVKRTGRARSTLYEAQQESPAARASRPATQDQNSRGSQEPNATP